VATISIQQLYILNCLYIILITHKTISIIIILGNTRYWNQDFRTPPTCPFVGCRTKNPAYKK